MTKDDVFKAIADEWQVAIDVLKEAVTTASENGNYQAVVHLTMAIEQCYMALYGNKPDFTGIEL